MTYAEFARHLSKINRLISNAQADLAEGMWNPSYCAAPCDNWAMSLIEEIRDRVHRIEGRIATPAPSTTRPTEPERG